MTVLTTSREVLEILSREESGVWSVKPRVLFRSVEENLSVPVEIKFQMPSSEIGSITLLEGAQMVAMLKLLRPSTVFEFGTFLGYTTALMARNVGESTRVISVDIHDDDFKADLNRDYDATQILTDGAVNDAFLRKLQRDRGRLYIERLIGEGQGRIELLQADSRKLDVDAMGISGNVDFVFIDGGHDTDTIASDTRKAVDMVGSSGVIVWHDYDSQVHTEVTEFVNDFAQEKVILRIESTMLAVLPIGEAAKQLYGSKR